MDYCLHAERRPCYGWIWLEINDLILFLGSQSTYPDGCESWSFLPDQEEDCVSHCVVFGEDNVGRGVQICAARSSISAAVAVEAKVEAVVVVVVARLAGDN